MTAPATMPASAPAPAIEHIVIINDLSRPLGGASALAVQSAIGFAQAGYRVTFLSGDHAPPGLGHDAITVIGLGQARLLARGRADALLSGWWNRAALAMVREFIAAHDTP